jgi:hypothetical protein
MIKPTKLKQEELQELQDFQQKSEFLISQLGQLQFKKLQIEKEELILKNSFDHITKLETELSEKLKTLYGDVQIDLKTGDIIYP